MAAAPALAMGALIGGTALKAGGQIYQADAQAQAMEAQSLEQANQIQESANMPLAQAQASDYNAQNDINQAAYTLAQYQQQGRLLGMKQQQEEGTIKATFGVNGVAQTGSALAIIEAKAANDALDRLTLKHEGVVKSDAFVNSANLEKFEAAQGRSQAAALNQRADYLRQTAPFYAQQTKDGGDMAALGTLISGGYQLSKMGGG